MLRQNKQKDTNVVGLWPSKDSTIVPGYRPARSMLVHITVVFHELQVPTIAVFVVYEDFGAVALGFAERPNRTVSVAELAQGFFLCQNGSSVLPKKCFARCSPHGLYRSVHSPHSCVLIRQEDTLINSITIDPNRARGRL